MSLTSYYNRRAFDILTKPPELCSCREINRRNVQLNKWSKETPQTKAAQHLDEIKKQQKLKAELNLELIGIPPIPTISSFLGGIIYQEALHDITSHIQKLNIDWMPFVKPTNHIVKEESRQIVSSMCKRDIDILQAARLKSKKRR